MTIPPVDPVSQRVREHEISSSEREILLDVRDLRVHFPTDFGVVKAVDGVSYSVEPGQTLAVVGESGSGKSVSALAVMGLVPRPGRITSGSIRFKGRELLTLADDEMRKLRGNRISMIFQDPLASLNPVHSVGRQVGEVIRVHEGISWRSAKRRALELLKVVGIPKAEERIDEYPHQFSGGMRQRVMIAMAMALKPALLIADEPTAALDVTIQAQILDLLRSLKSELNMSLILITHDLGVVAGHADKVAVMYAGRIAEYGNANDLYHNPLHPYAIGLMSSISRLDQKRAQRLRPIQGQPPSLLSVPPGCPFHPRCSYARQRCVAEYPELQARTGDSAHLVACHFAADLPTPHPPAEIST